MSFVTDLQRACYSDNSWEATEVWPAARNTPSPSTRPELQSTREARKNQGARAYHSLEGVGLRRVAACRPRSSSWWRSLALENTRTPTKRRRDGSWGSCSHSSFRVFNFLPSARTHALYHSLNHSTAKKTQQPPAPVDNTKCRFVSSILPASQTSSNRTLCLSTAETLVK